MPDPTQDFSSTRRITTVALLAAVGISLFVIESFIPMPFPFLKIGLANVSTLLGLFILGYREMFIVVIVRVVAGSILVGSLFSPGFILAISAGMSSAVIMALAKKTTGNVFGVIGISLLGSFAHVLTQLGVVFFLYVQNQTIFLLLPVLIFSSLGGGLVVGWIALRLLGSLPIQPFSVPLAPVQKQGIVSVGDAILIAVLGGVLIGSFFFVRAFAAEGHDVLIFVDGKVVHKASLLESGTTVVKGVRGDVMIEIRDGKVAITHADCPNHICVRTGWRSTAGDVIICVPNKTLVRITGEKSENVKAITG